MDTVPDIIRLMDAYCGATGRSRARVSTLIWDHGARAARIAAGAGYTVRTRDRGVRWFSDHWPEGAEWPDDIPRPAPSPGASPDLPVRYGRDGRTPADAGRANPTPSAENPTRASPASTDGDAGPWGVGGAPSSTDAAPGGSAGGPDPWAAARLNARGRIASPAALCRALGVSESAWANVLRYYADGAPRELHTPRRHSPSANLLRVATLAGDERFRRRQAREAGLRRRFP